MNYSLVYAGANTLLTLKILNPMKIEAYKCDYCGKLAPGDEAVGIGPIEDMFAAIESYPVIMNPARAEIHHCLECYDVQVLRPASNQHDRRKDEDGYKLKIRELYYSLRKSCILKVQSKKKIFR